MGGEGGGPERGEVIWVGEFESGREWTIVGEEMEVPTV